MLDMKKLDDKFRLTPWSSSYHADYIAGRYGSLLQDSQIAEAYVQGYERAEKKFDEAYEEQRRLLSEASARAGDKPQTLPDPVKSDWNPRKRFVPKEEHKSATTTIVSTKDDKPKTKKVVSVSLPK
jgi:hypothetical protein